MLGTIQERTATSFQSRGRSSDTRQRIMAVSLRLFARHGVPGTTIRDIARAAGISDAGIYYYFLTKDELLKEILSCELQPAIHSLERDCRRDTRDVASKIVDEAAGVIEANYRLFKIILTEGLAGDPVAVRRYDELLAAWKSRLGSHLKPLEILGVIPPGEAEPIACQIAFATVITFEDILLLRPERFSSCEERSQKAKVLLARQIDSMLAPPAGSSPVSFS